MNKSELVERVAERAGLGRGDALGRSKEAIERELAAGGEVSITGFGKFSVAERGRRRARNPQTGAPIELPAGRPPRLAPAPS